MRISSIRFSAGVICALFALAGVIHSRPAAAAVTVGNADYMYAIGQGGPVTISLNVTENFDINRAPLVSGTPRPLQLVDAFSSDTSVQVTKMRNCILITVPTPSAASFAVMYSVADAGDASGTTIAGGTLTFTGSSTDTYISPQNTTCADSQFQAVANADMAQAIAGQSILIPVLANDSPAAAPPNRRVLLGRDSTNGDIFFVTTAGGDAQAQPDNQILYVPRPDFAGTDTFSYIIVDYSQPGFETLVEKATVTVNVAPNPNGTAPDAHILVNGGTNTTVLDSDSQPGETVTFEAAPLDPVANPIPPTLTFDWFVGNETTPRQSGPSPKFTVALPDGTTAIKVVGTDSTDGSTGMLTTVVTVGATGMLAQLPGLTPNQNQVAAVLDRMCSDSAPSPSTTLTAEQQDALARCQAIRNASPSDQMRALDELSAKDFNGAQTQTLVFTRSTYSGVSDRLGSLRSGSRGVSAQGLSLIIDGKAIPLAEIERMVGKLLGGAAGADEPGSLLGDKLGFWTRGNISVGGKGVSAADNGFDADQFSLAMGMDYRITENTAVGTALSWGSSKVAYNPTGEGGLDTKSWALALYGSGYATQNGYFDAVVNIARSTYASRRHINYRDGLGLVDRNAVGDTDGLTFSGGLSAGYDFVFKGLTLSPNGGVFYAKSGINGFRERGAMGLNLIYDDQSFNSITANAGLRITYAWSVPFGVLMPYLRTDFVQELQNHVEVFNVRFASDMNRSSDPIAVTSSAPDQSYWRFSGGLSAQLRFGFSGYFEYQRLQGFELMRFADFAMGLRMQYRF